MSRGKAVFSDLSSLIGAIDRGLSLVSGRRLSILIFHRVHAQADPLFPGELDATRFRTLMAFVARTFRVVSLSEAVDGLREGNLTAGSVAITFDDGYRDNLEVAAPILQSLGLPATCFVASGFLDGGNMWNDRVVEAIRHGEPTVGEMVRCVSGLANGLDLGGVVNDRAQLCRQLLYALKYLPSEARMNAVERLESAIGLPPFHAPLMMSPEQVRALRSGGWEIGAHTVSHPILKNVGDEAAYNEIFQSKSRLEGILGESVRFFAYPNGKPNRDYRRRDVAFVRECGFEAAVSTAWGSARPGDSLYELPRFTPWDAQVNRFGLRMVVARRRHAYDRAAS